MALISDERKYGVEDSVSPNRHGMALTSQSSSESDADHFGGVVKKGIKPGNEVYE